MDPIARPNPAHGPAGFASFQDYQNAFDQARREAEFMRAAISRSGGVDRQLRAIQNARRFLGVRKLGNLISQGVPLGDALAQAPEAFTGSMSGLKMFHEINKPVPKWRYVPAQAGAPEFMTNDAGDMKFIDRPSTEIPASTRRLAINDELDVVNEQLSKVKSDIYKDGQLQPLPTKASGVVDGRMNWRFPGSANRAEIDDQQRAEYRRAAGLARRKFQLELERQRLQGQVPVIPSASPAPTPVAPVQAAQAAPIAPPAETRPAITDEYFEFLNARRQQ